MKSVIYDLHRQLISGERTCREIVQEKQSLLAENEYQSVNLLLGESSLAAADQIDEKIKSGGFIGLLEGIPFGIKDVIHLQGCVTSGSSGFLKNYISPYTATAVQKLLDTGAIPVVKENCDSFGHGVTGKNSIFGAVCNAHDKSRVAGGSSSGSAVNVAKGYTAFSIGGDTGGAIPAGYNKIYSLKPTFGRVSRYGIMANCSATDGVGPMAASLEDIRILLNVMSGKDVHDQIAFATTAIPDDIFNVKEQITVGYYKRFLENKILDATIKSAFEKMLATISNHGIRVIPLDSFDTDAVVATALVLAMADASSLLARFDGTLYGARSNNKNVLEGYMITRSENLSDESKRRITGGIQALSHGYEEDVFPKAKIMKSRIVNALNEDFEKTDIILSPATVTLPPTIDQSLDDPFMEAFSAGFNLGGVPTLTAPLFTPTGIQVTANKNREGLILTFTNFLEEAE